MLLKTNLEGHLLGIIHAYEHVTVETKLSIMWVLIKRRQTWNMATEFVLCLWMSYFATGCHVLFNFYI